MKARQVALLVYNTQGRIAQERAHQLRRITACFLHISRSCGVTARPGPPTLDCPPHTLTPACHHLEFCCGGASQDGRWPFTFGRHLTVPLFVWLAGQADHVAVCLMRRADTGSLQKPTLLLKDSQTSKNSGETYFWILRPSPEPSFCGHKAFS